MTYELIITEKPAASKKIADALADGKALKQDSNGVAFYKVTHGNKDIVIGCAVGHLYTLAEKPTEGKKKWTYPVFDIEWQQSSQVRKDAAFTSKYVTALKKLAKDATEFTVATDYDIEGEVIGLNVVRYICKKKDANRMKYSTLTQDELVRAYEHKNKTLDWGQANAGETRHFLDYFYGINLSRALSLSIKTTGMFKILSAGRVQGPALKIIVDKEKEIKAFISKPYWQIELHGAVKKSPIIALHEQDMFWDKKKAEKILEKTKGKPAVIDALDKSRFNQAPPYPFDLTTLQTEAYRSLRIQPKDTLAIAQSLYLGGLISYPRTSSQVLPPEIGYKKILTDLGKQETYAPLAKKLLGLAQLKPNNGKKTDPAHPALYPTGIRKNLEGREARIYDLVVRRFLATFAEPATRETMTITIDVNKELFVTKGTRTVFKGWHEFYGPHVKLEEIELPSVQKGDKVDVEKILMLDKETQPPKRYTPASIIKELEKRNLGTKATRAAIVDNLYQRGYVHESSIQATELGIRTCGVLEKYCPEILDEELTRHFEMEMDEVREGKKKEEEVLTEAESVLKKILTRFKQNEKNIGAELAAATKETRDEISYIGKCPNCPTGDLQVRFGRFGRFIACNKYPDCKTTFSLPKAGNVKSLKKECEQCKFPLILMSRKKGRPSILCINARCPTKQLSEEKLKETEMVANGQLEKKCPKCQGQIVLRNSIYGKFYGCKTYPKCRYTEKIMTTQVGEAPEEGESAQ